MAIFLPERTASAIDTLTPRQIVTELDKFVVGQAKAKRAVAIALRNRIRRQRLSPEIAEELGLSETKGALVSKVIEEGPGAKAGIEKMDVIREFDGKPVEDYDDLPRIVASTPVNKKVDISVIRDGKRVVLHPKIALLEEPEDVQKTSATPAQQSRTPATLTQDSEAPSRMTDTRVTTSACSPKMATAYPAFGASATARTANRLPM